MEKLTIDDFVKLPNPTPGTNHRPEIITGQHKAKELGGMFGILVPGGSVPYHYHTNRESVIFFISGEGIEIREEGELPVRAGDVLFIPAGEKHATVNRSDHELRYLEFFTRPPVGADFVEVKDEP